MTVSPPDFHLLSSNPWNYQPADLMVDLLKLAAWLNWPSDKYEAQRHHFLARNVISLQDALENRKAIIRKSTRVGDAFKHGQIARAEEALAGLREQLLQPAGGVRAAAQMSDREFISILATRSRHARTAASIVEFILRYDAHIPKYRRGASVTKAAAFIEGGGFSDRDLLKSRADIISAWSDYKPVAHFCFSNAFLSGPFCCFDIQSPEPLRTIDDFWWNETLHEAFFGVALYAERTLTRLTPSGAKEPLLKEEELLSVGHLLDIPELCPRLAAFSGADVERIANFKTREHWLDKGEKPVPTP